MTQSQMNQGRPLLNESQCNDWAAMREAHFEQCYQEIKAVIIKYYGDDSKDWEADGRAVTLALSEPYPDNTADRHHMIHHACRGVQSAALEMNVSKRAEEQIAAHEFATKLAKLLRGAAGDDQN